MWISGTEGEDQVMDGTGGNMSPGSSEGMVSIQLEIPDSGYSGYAMPRVEALYPYQGKRMYRGYQIKYTDTGFLEVFSSRFSDR